MRKRAVQCEEIYTALPPKRQWMCGQSRTNIYLNIITKRFLILHFYDISFENRKQPCVSKLQEAPINVCTEPAGITLIPVREESGIQTITIEGHWKFEGGGVKSQEYETHRGGGFKTKNPSVGRSMYIFWNMLSYVTLILYFWIHKFYWLVGIGNDSGFEPKNFMMLLVSLMSQIVTEESWMTLSQGSGWAGTRDLLSLAY